jgi:hypothetical protein
MKDAVDPSGISIGNPIDRPNSIELKSSPSNPMPESLPHRMLGIEPLLELEKSICRIQADLIQLRRVERYLGQLSSLAETPPVGTEEFIANPGFTPADDSGSDEINALPESEMGLGRSLLVNYLQDQRIYENCTRIESLLE